MGAYTAPTVASDDSGFPQISIPTSHVAVIRLLASLGQPEYLSVHQVLTDPGPDLDRPSIARVLANRVSSINEEQAGILLAAIASFAGAAVQYGWDLDQATRSIVTQPELALTEEQGLVLSSRLGDLARSRYVTFLNAALDALTNAEHPFFAASIHTDIRTVFPLGADQPIDALTAFPLFVLTITHGSDTNELTKTRVTLDDGDLVVLRNTLDRAVRLSGSARTMIGSLDLSYPPPESL